MYWPIIINIIEILLILLIGGYILYFKTYFKEKGKNLAQKEDIRDLTSIVEDVRHDYSKDIESLKADLSLLITKRSAVFEEEKLSIIQFFTQINTWVWDTLKIETHEYFHGNFEELNTKIIRFRDAYKQTNVAFSKVQLLVKDENLIQAGHEYVTEALKLHSFIDLTVSALKRNLSQEKINVDLILKELRSQVRPVPKDDPLNNYLLKTAKELELERKTLVDSYGTKYLELFGPVMRKRDVFMELTKAYLNSDAK